MNTRGRVLGLDLLGQLLHESKKKKKRIWKKCSRVPEHARIIIISELHQMLNNKLSKTIVEKLSRAKKSIKNNEKLKVTLIIAGVVIVVTLIILAPQLFVLAIGF